MNNSNRIYYKWANQFMTFFFRILDTSIDSQLNLWDS